MMRKVKIKVKVKKMKKRVIMKMMKKMNQIKMNQMKNLILIQVMTLVSNKLLLFFIYIINNTKKRFEIIY